MPIRYDVILSFPAEHYGHRRGEPRAGVEPNNYELLNPSETAPPVNKLYNRTRLGLVDAIDAEPKAKFFQ